MPSATFHPSMKSQPIRVTILAALFSILVSSPTPAAVQPAGAPALGAAARPSSIPTQPPFAGGRKTSFAEVTSLLDPGGSLFLYLATDQWLANLSTKVSDFRQVMLAMPIPGMMNRDQIEASFNLAGRLIKSSGIEDISGVGMSDAPIAPDLFRSKFVLGHAQGAGQGYLWSMFGKSPHALTGQAMLPTNTVFAAFGDLDLTQLWQVLERELAQSGIPEATAVVQAFPQLFEMQTQLKWPQMLGSLGGELGVVLTLDESKRIAIPLGKGKIEIPTPALLVALKVNNDLIYDRASAELKEKLNAVAYQEPGLKLSTIAFPMPLPIQLQPTLASSGDYLFIASSPDAIRTVQAVRQGRAPGLKGTEDFKALAKFLPAQGNQFFYYSKSLGTTINEIQTQVMKESGLVAQDLGMLQKLISPTQPAHGLAVGAHTATGWQTTSVGNQEATAGLAMAPIAGVAVGAGMILPAMAQAKTRAQATKSSGNVRALNLGALMFADDNGKFPNAQTWSDDLMKYVGNASAYKSPDDQGPGRSSYAFNRALSGLAPNKVNPQTVLFFEADGTWNQNGGLELLPPQPRSGGTYVIGFADGSVQRVAPARVPMLRWLPMTPEL